MRELPNLTTIGRPLVAALAAIVVACSPSPPEPPAAPVIQFANLTGDPVAHGERLAQVLGCLGCHGADLTGQDWSDDMGVLWTSNLTRSAHSLTEAELKAAIKDGVRPGRALWVMPSHLFTQLSDADTAAIIAYLKSHPPSGEMHPEPTFTDALRSAIAEDKVRSSHTDVVRHGRTSPPYVGPQHAFARYAVRATCAECHGMNLTGEQPPFGGKARPDLNVAAAYSLEDFRTLMRTGKAVGGRELELMSEVARGRYSGFTDGEVASIHAYLVARAAAAPPE